jgi:hypothetical protein
VLSLKGLAGINVFVDSLDTTATQAGVTEDALRVDTELRLRRAGVRLLALKEMQENMGYPFLHIGVNMVCLPTAGLCAYSVQLKLQQAVKCRRDKAPIGGMATTWDLDMIGTLAKDGANVSRGVRDALGDLVDHLLNDYLTANPKSP